MLTLLISGLSYSQDKKINPTNLGCLRLGMSYDELSNLPPIKIKEYETPDYWGIEELKPYENGRKNDSILSYYKVRNINISPNIKVEYVVLGFYNDILFYIKIEDDHLLSSLEYKYGEPNYNYSYDTIVCQTYKNGCVHKDTFNYYIQNWGTNNGTILKWTRRTTETSYGLLMDIYTEFYYSDIFNKVKPILLKQESDYNQIQKQKEIEEENKKHLGF